MSAGEPRTSSVGAREEILGRVRRALADRPEPAAVVRDYHGPGELILADPVATLTERLTDYRARVHRCPAGAARETIGAILAAGRITRVVVPPGFPADLLDPDAADWRHEAGPPGAGLSATGGAEFTAADLDAMDGVITTCAYAIALTGTIILDAGPGQGRRALSLVPDYHLVVVRTGQIVAGVPDAVGAVAPDAPLTWISGPSATSDIELNRVEGVHGPRRLEVLIVDDPNA